MKITQIFAYKKRNLRSPFIRPSVMQETASLLNLLLGVETQAPTQSPAEPEEMKSHVSQRLQRELSGFFHTLLLRLTHTSDR